MNERAGAAVQQDEGRFPQARVVQDGFEQQRMRSAQKEITAATCAGVNVHRQTQAASLSRDIAEQSVLQSRVIAFRRSARARVFRVDRRGVTL